LTAAAPKAAAVAGATYCVAVLRGAGPVGAGGPGGPPSEAGSAREGSADINPVRTL